jgi:hypothetical protein
MSAHLIWIILPVSERWYLSVFLRLRPVKDILVLFRVFELFRHDDGLGRDSSLECATGSV